MEFLAELRELMHESLDRNCWQPTPLPTFRNIQYTTGNAGSALILRKPNQMLDCASSTWNSPNLLFGHALDHDDYFEHAAQYPPISSRDTTIRNRQSFSTCPFSFSKMSLTNSMILPQRRQAMWMWSRFSLRS